MIDRCDNFQSRVQLYYIKADKNEPWENNKRCEKVIIIRLLVVISFDPLSIFDI